MSKNTEQDATEYLLSTKVNRNHLQQALQELEKKQNYIYVNLFKDIHEDLKKWQSLLIESK